MIQVSYFFGYQDKNTIRANHFFLHSRHVSILFRKNELPLSLHRYKQQAAVTFFAKRQGILWRYNFQSHQ
jgi:hypothetical protein